MLFYISFFHLDLLSNFEHIKIIGAIFTKKHTKPKFNKDKFLNIKQIKTLIKAGENILIHLQILFALLIGLRKQKIKP